MDTRISIYTETRIYSRGGPESQKNRGALEYVVICGFGAEKNIYCEVKIDTE